MALGNTVGLLATLLLRSRPKWQRPESRREDVRDQRADPMCCSPSSEGCSKLKAMWKALIRIAADSCCHGHVRGKP